MPLVVVKFGGTSLSNAVRIQRACEHIVNHKKNGEQVVVVVSAMAGVTDQLVSLVKEVSVGLNGAVNTNGAEHDIILSSGENVSAGLVAQSLISMGNKARSWTSWQLPIEVSGEHTDANITNIAVEKLKDNLAQGIIPVVTGFQGCSNDRVYTLGRGGTDTTAVALADALGADKCYIYTDVEGVFSADPRIVAKARKIKEISYSEMLELSQNGAKVMHAKAVLAGFANKVNIEVLSSFTANPGTNIVADYENEDSPKIKGISLQTNLIKISGVASYDTGYIRKKLQQYGVNVVSINAKNEEWVDIIIKEVDLQNAEQMFADSLLEKSQKNITKNVSQICIVGKKVWQDKSNIEKLMKVVNHEKVDILSTQISDLSLKLIVIANDIVSITSNIHNAFGLDVEVIETNKRGSYAKAN